MVDELYLLRMLRTMVEARGSHRGVARDLGLSPGRLNSVYNVLVKHERIPETLANALGYKRKVPGQFSRACLPVRYIALSPSSNTGQA